MIWAWKDPDPTRKASFYVPFDWLQGAWSKLHGAFHVNLKRIGGSDKDARRLSRYIVAQYCGGQNALVRLSQSRMDYPLAKMRAELLRTVKNLPERYAIGPALAQSWGSDELLRISNMAMWGEFRVAWDSLVKSRSCRLFGVSFVWWDGRLERA